MKKHLLIIACTIFVAGIAGCKSNDEPSEEPLEAKELVVSTESVECEYNQKTAEFTVKSGSKWICFNYVQDPMIDQVPDWADVVTSSGVAQKEYIVKVNLATNNSPGERKCTVAVQNEASDEPKYITLTQKGKETTEKTAYLSSEKIVSNSYFNNVSGNKTTIKSDIFGLWFFGWSIDDDKRFHLNFPENNSKYNRVIMTYRMGCGPSGGSGYDHNTNIALKYEGEWYEISNCITPFGNAFTSSFEKKYYFDVTEYLPMLKGDVEFKIYFGGFDAQETGRHHTAQLTFDMYEGQSERNQVFVKRIYDSEETQNTGYRSWLYGREGESIEEGDRFSNRTITVPSTVKSLQMKVTITGHGADQGRFVDRTGYQTKNAAEFDYNYYTVKIDGVPCQQRGYIFVPCGENYAQAGTCYYDRANWCPGNPSHIDIWKFVNIKGGDTFDIDFDLERFESEYKTSANGQAMYRVHVDLFGFDK